MIDPKETLTRLIPPVLLDLAQRNRSRTARYDSYESASADADSYEDSVLTDLVAAKGKQFASVMGSASELDYSHLRILSALIEAPNSQTLRVLDFGGGSGTHYCVARKLLSDDVQLDWRVVETLPMVEAVMNHNLSNHELTFYSDIREAASGVTFDAIYASSSIQYTPDPYGTLQALCGIAARRLVIARTPMAEYDVVLLQKSRMRDNGPGPVPQSLESVVGSRRVSYPVTILELKRVSDIVKEFSNSAIFIKEDESLASKRSRFQMYGLVATSKRKIPAPAPN